MKNNNIQSKEISVVIQGPIYGSNDELYENRFTQRACDSVRKYLPDAEIIISTWESSVVEGLDYDILIENCDPGFNYMLLNDIVRPNNTNRMILSSINGIKAANRKYCIKMRSDMVILNGSFINYFGKYKKYSKGKVVKERLITLSATHPYRGAHCAFAVNDWFAFGYTEDLKKVWDIPLQSVSDFYKDEKYEYPRWEDNVVAEQHVWTTFLKKSEYYANKIKISNMNDLSNDAVPLFEQSIAENLVILTAKQMKVNSLKLPNRNYVRRDFMKMSCYTHHEWKEMYNRYCNGGLILLPNISDMINKCLYKLTFLIQKQINPIYMIGKQIYNKHFISQKSE